MLAGNPVNGEPGGGTFYEGGTGGGTGGSGTGTGTGGSGTGTSTSTSAAAAGLRSAAYSGGSSQIEIPIAGKNGVPVRGPALAIGPNDYVDVAAFPGNTKVVFVAMGMSEVQSGPRAQLAASSNPRSYTVNNLAQIWIMTQVDGEGVLFTVRKK